MEQNFELETNEIKEIAAVADRIFNRLRKNDSTKRLIFKYLHLSLCYFNFNIGYRYIVIC